MSTFPSSYKFNDLELVVSPDLIVYSRQTYDALALMSDLSGLFEFSIGSSSFLSAGMQSSIMQASCFRN